MKTPSFSKNIIYWNRKFHFYVGLFLLLFIWLFSFSGLLLNNSQWEFASFWKERKEMKTIMPVTIPAQLDNAALLQNFMEQLKISGEINNVKFTPDSVDFRVVTPGISRDIHVDLKKRISVQKEMKFNLWGKMRTLHTFNGADKANPETQPNWLVTRIWRFAMDGIAIGLIFLCISSWVMWYKIRESYIWGPVVLILGFAGAIYFVFLLRML